MGCWKNAFVNILKSTRRSIGHIEHALDIDIDGAHA